MTEAVRLQWIYSMHKCAEIHNAMTAITDLQHTTSEQHIELGNSRSSRAKMVLINTNHFI